MFSLKKIAVSFAIGFTISLIAGIVGGVNFATLLLRAMLSGLFFALVVSGAMLLYRKFLLNGESTFDTLQHENATVQSGGNVDITLDDDDLPDSVRAPSFSLGEMASLDPVDEKQDAVLDQQNGDSLRPDERSTVVESAVNQTGEEKTEDSSRETFSGGVSGEEITPRDEQSQSVADGELDILPEIEDIVGNGNDIASSDDGQIIQDSVFAETGETKPIIPAGFSDMGDVRDIAAAIRTALTKDT